MKYLPLFLCCCFGLGNGAGALVAQEGSGETGGIPAGGIPKAGDVQEALKQWVLTRQIISREKADWAEEKASLADLNEVRRREIRQLGEFSKAANLRVAEIDEKRKQFKEEEAALKAWRLELGKQISTLEKQLLPLIPLFPPPLRAKMEEVLARLEAPDPKRPLQHRIRDVLLVMGACLNFQSVISLDADIRSIDGEQREVEVLYLGFTQAWYVDRSGAYSGYGTPGREGWVWKEEPALATTVRRAIAIQSRQATPGFVTLPLSNTAASAASKK